MAGYKASAFVVAFLLIAATPVAAAEPPADPMPDASSLADRMGWDLSQAVDYLDQQERFGQLVTTLATEYPRSFAGGWREREPDVSAVVRFKGDVPDRASELATTLGVTSLTLRSDAEYSEAELGARADRLHQDLMAMGSESVSTGYSIQDQTIISAATRPPALAGRSATELNALLGFPSGARDVAVEWHDGPVGADYVGRGGASILASNLTTVLCTTGWAVRVNTIGGTTGVVTAGHCPATFHRVKDHISGALMDPSHVTQHIGAWGDMEWHTLSPAGVDATFHPNGASTRAVTAIDQTIAVGDYFCQFGRVTSYAKCDFVLSTNQSCLGASRLVAMQGLQLQEGDSGGPVYYNYTAAGIVKGRCTVSGYQRDLWTRAMYFEEGLGITVLTQ